MKLTAALACSLFAGRPKPGHAMTNPATDNCVNQNYTSENLYQPTGGEYGLCIFSNETACEEWRFLRGECNTTNPIFSSYCADNGGQVSQENVTFPGEGNPPATYEMCTVNENAQCDDMTYYLYNNCSFTAATSDSPSLGGGGGTIGSPNPASVGCADKGGTSKTLYDNEGGQYGVCLFSDGTACEEWALERGECAEGDKPVFATYCTDIGGEMSNESVTFVSEGNPPATYEVCTLNGAKCAANYYYTSGCANFPQTSTGVSSPPPTPDSTSLIGIPNPASVGCADKGGTSETLFSEGDAMSSSGEYGVCLFSDGTACDEWALERGECAEGDKPVFATYCADAGGELSNEDSQFVSDGAPIGTYEVCTVNGAQCAAYDYYSSVGCADFPATATSEEGVSSPPPTPAASTPTVTTSSPVSGAPGLVLGAFFNVGLFGAIYFAI